MSDPFQVDPAAESDTTPWSPALSCAFVSGWLSGWLASCLRCMDGWAVGGQTGRYKLQNKDEVWPVNGRTGEIDRVDWQQDRPAKR